MLYLLDVRLVLIDEFCEVIVVALRDHFLSLDYSEDTNNEKYAINYNEE